MSAENSLISLSSLFSHRKDQTLPEIAKEAFALLAHYSDQFLKKRTSLYLLKIAKSHHNLVRHFSKKIPSKETRSIFLKFLAVKFEKEHPSRKVLGIALCFNFYYGFENFNQNHLSKILKKLIPGASILDESFYLSNSQIENRLICYCEIEKIRGKNLTLKECFHLKKNLGAEIRDGIEFLSPHLSITENEEEILKSILSLHKEVTSSKDLPHVMISFQGQNQKLLTFRVILVRMISIEDPSIKDLIFQRLIDASLHTYRTDLIKEGLIKETGVFFLNIKNSLFYRKNYTIDLLKARQYTSMLLEKIIGEFRDYNGGLLTKQTEQFDSFKQELIKQMGDISLFEELFYSFTPSNLQLLISFEIALELCQAFYDLNNAPLTKSYDTKSSQSKDMFFLLIRTDSSIFDSIFLDLPSSSLIATSSKVIQQKKYHCLIQIHPPNLNLMQYIQNKLMKLEEKALLLKRKEFRTTFQHFPPSFHPHLTTDIRSLTLCKALFEGLTRVSPQEKVEPALAQKITISPCKKVYTFTLRPSKWSNGEELTSYHFANAWKEAISFSSNCIRVKNFFLIKHAKQINQGILPLEKIGIHTPSKEKLVVELEYPAPYFLQLLADPVYSPLYGEDIKEEPSIFNGPFLLGSNPLKDQIHLNYNPLYWDIQSVHLERIIIFLIKDSYKAYEMYEKKELDLVGSPLNSLPKQVIEESKDLKFYEPNFPFWLFCNTQNPKLASVKIRKALSYAIDRDLLVKTILPFQKPSYSIIPEPISTLNSKDFFPSDAISQALPLFEQGLQEANLNKEEFELNFSHSNVPEQKALTHFIKNTWETVLGIKINLIENPWNSYWNSVFNHEYEIAGLFLSGTYDGLAHLMDFFENSFNNFSNWENKKYKKHLITSKTTANKNRRIPSFKKAEEILNNELPVIPVYNHIFLYLNNELFQNFIFSKFGYIDFKCVRFR